MGFYKNFVYAREQLEGRPLYQQNGDHDEEGGGDHKVRYINYNQYGENKKDGGDVDGGDKNPNLQNYGSVSTDGDLEQEERKDGQAQFSVYPQRWAVLAALSALSCINNWIWITWSPLMPNVATFWDVPDSYVNDLAGAYMYVAFPICFPVIWFLHRYSLRTGLTVSAGLNFVGSLLRFFHLENYYWVYTGTILCALCQTMALALPPLVSTFWFPMSERGLATSIAMFSYQLGATLGLGSTIVTTFAEGETIQLNRLSIYLGIQMALSGLVLLFIVFCIRTNRPPTPPSRAATLETELSYIESMRKLFGTRSGTIFFVVYGLCIGVFYTVKTFLAQFLIYEAEDKLAYSWSEKEVGYLGLTLNLVGQIGSIAAGEYLDRTKRYRGILISQATTAAVALFAFVLILQEVQVNRLLTYGVLGVFGFALAGFLPVGFEYSTAISYPADDAIVSGLMNASTQFGSWILITGGSHVRPVGNGTLALVLACTVAVADALHWAFVRAKSKRPGETEARKLSRTTSK